MWVYERKSTSWKWDFWKGFRNSCFKQRGWAFVLCWVGGRRNPLIGAFSPGLLATFFTILGNAREEAAWRGVLNPDLWGPWWKEKWGPFPALRLRSSDPGRVGCQFFQQKSRRSPGMNLNLSLGIFPSTFYWPLGMSDLAHFSTWVLI